MYRPIQYKYNLFYMKFTQFEELQITDLPVEKGCVLNGM